MFILLFNFAILCDLLGLRRICAWLLLFVSICNADKDPNIKRGLGTHFSVYPRHIIVHVSSQDIDIPSDISWSFLYLIFKVRGGC